MTRERFEELVRQALASIPSRFRTELHNLAIVIENQPSAALLEEMEVSPPDTLFGVYQGTPLTDRPWAYGNVLPDRIAIFQRPIEEACEDEAEIIATVGETLIHEIGHYFGLSEEELEEIEDRYWRRQMRLE